ncbi:MAG: hypothetical protein ACI9VR_003247 [Cognaticolwellia sp.]|jgi:hypothetical protein
MAQVTLYVDEETLQRGKQAAKSAGMSMSAWVSELIRQRTRQQWPNEVCELAGAWPDFPTAEQLRRGPNDTPREDL